MPFQCTIENLRKIIHKISLPPHLSVQTPIPLCLSESLCSTIVKKSLCLFLQNSSVPPSLCVRSTVVKKSLCLSLSAFNLQYHSAPPSLCVRFVQLLSKNLSASPSQRSTSNTTLCLRVSVFNSFNCCQKISLSLPLSVQPPIPLCASESLCSIRSTVVKVQPLTKFLYTASAAANCVSCNSR